MSDLDNMSSTNDEEKVQKEKENVRKSFQETYGSLRSYFLHLLDIKKDTDFETTTDSILKDISNPSAGFDILIPVLVMYPILIGIMAWKYKWTNWREKLFGNITPPPKLSEEQIEY